MINKEKCLVFDIDGTICPIKKSGERYEDLIPGGFRREVQHLI